MKKPISIIVVRIDDEKYTATMRFKDPMLDKMYSATSRDSLYMAIEKYLSK